VDHGASAPGYAHGVMVVA